MTLEEAINHAQERATQDCSECAQEHQQLSDWLTELKQYRELENNRLANLDNLTEEETEREMEFVVKFIESNHRPPTYSDAIEITRKRMFDKACEAYCNVCDTKECEEWGCEIECNWVKKFKKAFLTDNKL